jgi:hypothetical protein
MNKVVRFPPQSSMLEEDVTVDFDTTDVQKAAMSVFDEMLDGGCGLRDCIMAVYLAGMEKVIGSKPANRTKKPAIPPCPYAQIVDLYHERLPELATVRMMGAERKKAIRKFWVWIFESHKNDGTKRATTAEEGIAWVGAYFTRAVENDWLMGRSGRSTQWKDWEADIDYVVSPSGIKQIVEKTR